MLPLSLPSSRRVLDSLQWPLGQRLPCVWGAPLSVGWSSQFHDALFTSYAPAYFLQLSFLGPELVCEWGISSSTEGLLTTLVFVGMMM